MSKPVVHVKLFTSSFHMHKNMNVEIIKLPSDIPLAFQRALQFNPPQHIHILKRVKTVSAAGVHLHQNAGYDGSIVSQRADES